MNRKIFSLCAIVGSLSVSAVAHAVCFELTDYRPWDPKWIGAAVSATSSGNKAALRAVGVGATPAARFRSDGAAAVECTTNAARTSFLVTAESSTGQSTALHVESSAPAGSAVRILGGTSGPLIRANSGPSEVFSVEHDGTVLVRGQPILLPGPAGANGANGSNGGRGPTGPAGSDYGAADYPACVQQNCLNVCTHGVVSSAQAPCTVTAATNGTCTNNTSGGYCCRCARP